MRKGVSLPPTWQAGFCADPVLAMLALSVKIAVRLWRGHIPSAHRTNVKMEIYKKYAA